MKQTLTYLGLLILCSCSAPQNEVPESYDLLLVNAKIIDIASGTTGDPAVIGIIGDTIRLVTDLASASGFNATRILDLEGQYVMPGLWDNHVHFRGGDSLENENRNLLPLFLAHGVTTIRDAGGDITPAVLRWRREIRSGALAGPAIFTSGPKLDGNDPSWEGSISVETDSDVATALDSLENSGLDYVKIYDGSLTPGMYYEIIKQATERGLPVTGHVPLNADIIQAVDYGLNGTEHLYFLLHAGSRISDSLKATMQGYDMLPALASSYDDKFALPVFEALGEKSFYVTPTLFIGQVLNTLPVTDHSADSLLGYIGPGIRNTYRERIASAMRRTPEDQRLDDRLENIFATMIRPLQDAGVSILAGSDCGPYNSFVYPGASLVGELEALVALGNLSPAEALASSVINGPAFFGLSHIYGAIGPGKVADIIVLEKNPMDNISNIRSLTLVIDGSYIIASGRLLK